MFITLNCVTTYAQRQGHMLHMKQQLKDSLQFSDVMADTVVSVQKDFGPKTREIFMNHSLSQEEKQTQVLALNEQKKIRLKKAGLSDEQIAKLEAWQKSHMHNRMGDSRLPENN